MLYNCYALDKEIPKIEYLKEHGSTYGKFCDLDTNKYNGYDVSYALIRCLIKNFTKQEIKEVIRDKNKLATLEENIIQLFLNEK